jgi:predicted MarR family transcription regulator
MTNSRLTDPEILEFRFPSCWRTSTSARGLGRQGQSWDRPKTLSDLCLVLDIEDTHIANYAVKKLETAGLVKTGKVGKEKMIQTTDKGVAALEQYSEIRERLLVEATKVSGLSQDDLSDIASHLRALSGYYEQAARSAATL